MKKLFYVVSILAFSLVSLAPAFSQKLSANAISQDDAFLQGCEAFRNEDWISAMFFLKRAVTAKKFATDEVRYMLITAEMRAGEYKMAESDCASFLNDYPKSAYYPFAQYNRGRALHSLGNNEQAIVTLSDFCHENADSELYPASLFWIAESFYNEYNYDSARALYERIVMEYPSDSVAKDAQRKLDAIDQRNREEKLLYLLKVTGEEYMASKEDYERQLKLYKTEDMMGLKKQLSAAQDKIAELERQLEQLKYVGAEEGESVVEQDAIPPVLQDPSDSYAASTTNQGYLSEVPDINALKRKARHLQDYMGSGSEENLDAAMKETVYETIYPDKR